MGRVVEGWAAWGGGSLLRTLPAMLSSPGTPPRSQHGGGGEGSGGEHGGVPVDEHGGVPVGEPGNLVGVSNGSSQLNTARTSLSEGPEEEDIGGEGKGEPMTEGKGGADEAGRGEGAGAGAGAEDGVVAEAGLEVQEGTATKDAEGEVASPAGEPSSPRGAGEGEREGPEGGQEGGERDPTEQDMMDGLA